MTAKMELSYHPPVFSTIEEERNLLKQKLAASFRLFSKFGFDEGVAGHITARDPEFKDHFLVNPFGMHFSQIKASDLILCNHEGGVVEGNYPVNRVAFAIHSQVHAARPDVIAAAMLIRFTGNHGLRLAVCLIPLPKMPLKESCLILTLQNGVDNEEILSSIFGDSRILSAAAYIQAIVTDSGAVKQIGVPPRLIIGALDTRLVGKVEEIATLFNAANIETFTSSNVLRIKWNKLLWNVTFNPLTALIESKVGTIYDDEGLNQLALKICKEAIAVAVAMGIEIEVDFYETFLAQGQLARDHHTSMLQDKLRGKTMELESICGYIVKKGKEVNVETPVLETIYYLLSYQMNSVKA